MHYPHQKISSVGVFVLCSLLIGAQAIDKTAVVAGVLGYAGGYIKGSAVHDWYLGGRGYGYPAYGYGGYGYGGGYGGGYGYTPYAYGYGRQYPVHYAQHYPAQGYGYPGAW